MNEIENRIEGNLPPHVEFFTPVMLASFFNVSKRHILNLIDSGVLDAGIDIRAKGSKRSCMRIPRKSVVQFLSKRMVQS